MGGGNPGGGGGGGGGGDVGSLGTTKRWSATA